MAMYRKVCLVGIDRIAGSFAQGLKRIGFRGSLVGVAEPETISRAWKLGMISDGFQSLPEAIVGADLVMLSSGSALPGTSLADVLELADEGATISEMTRVGGDVNRIFEESGRSDVRYVGFRLLGDAASESDLAEMGRFFFEGRSVILTPRARDDVQAFMNLQDVMRRLGAKVVPMSPQAHDRMLAQFAHVPATVALVMLESIFEFGASITITPDMLGRWLCEEIGELDRLRGSGWARDLEANRERVQHSLDQLIERLWDIREHLVADELALHLETLIARSKGLTPQGRNKDTADLILIAGQDLRMLEKTSELLATSRLSIVHLDRMDHTEPGTYRLSLKSPSERDRALQVLSKAGVKVEPLSS